MILLYRIFFMNLLSSAEILQAKRAYQSSLATLGQILNSLEDLGDKMESMLQQQSGIEVCFLALFTALILTPFRLRLRQRTRH